MLEVDLKKILDDFRRLANDYRSGHELRVGLDLDDASIRLYSAAGYLIKNQTLTSKLHEFRQAVRTADHANSDRLHDEIEEILATVQTGDQAPAGS
jgi:hypothetical protein